MARWKRHKSRFISWIKALVIAFVIVLATRTFFYESFLIDHPYMANTVMEGDYVLGKKLKYGIRLPVSPLALPMFERKVYSGKITFPPARIGGKKPGLNDLVFFNYPLDTLLPLDKRHVCIGRVVGRPGDTLIIRDKMVHVNGRKINNPATITNQYSIQAYNQDAYQYLLDQFGNLAYEKQDVSERFKLVLTEDEALQLHEDENVKSISQYFLKEGRGDTLLFPHSAKVYWNRHHFGPLVIPGKGQCMELKDPVRIFYQEFMPVSGSDSVCFDEDYYFVMYDNRDKGIDSRYWGFLPATHIFGQPGFVWFSYDKNQKGFKKVRWERIGKNLE